MIAWKRCRRQVASCWMSMAVAMMLCGAPAIASTDTLTLRAVLPATDRMVEVSRENFDLECREAEQGWAPQLISTADAARRRLGEVTHDSLMVRIRMILAPTQEQFLKLTGSGAENSVAVSMSGRQLVIINMEQLRSQGFERVGRLLVHELAHVYLDVRCRGPVPRWMHEGIAQAIAGDVSGSASSLAIARMFNRLIPLSEIEHRFPSPLERQQLAYRQSHSVVRFLVEQRFDGSLPALLQSVSGPEGAHNLELYWSPVFRDALQSQWQKSMGGVREWALAIVTSGTFWTIMAVLTIIAWLARRRRSKALHREWDEEEKIYAVLDEEERKQFGDEDPDNDPYAVPGEYVDNEYEDVYENGEWVGRRKVE